MSDNSNIKNKLYEKVINFFISNNVSCEESIIQTDSIYEKLPDFVCDLYGIIEEDLNN